MRAPTATVLTFMLLSQPLTAQESSATIIRDVAVVDVMDGSVDEHQSVVIEGGWISTVGPAGEVPVPPGTEVVEGAGKYVMPGLADMHVHFGRGGGLPNSPESVERVLRQYLYYGVTSVLNLGAYHGRADQIVDLRRRREAGGLLSPHIYATGGLLTVPGGHPVDHWSLPAGAEPGAYDWSERGVWVVRTPSDVRAVVARVSEAGMEGVKVIVESDHVGEPIPRMSPVLLEAAVEEAGRYGLPVFAHANSISELEAVVDAGMEAVVHLARCCWPGEELGPQYGPGPALLERMRTQGIYYVPALSVMLWSDDLWVDFGDYLTDPFLSGVEPHLIDTLLASPPEPAGEVGWAWRRAVLETLKEAHDAGIRLVAGSDPPGEYTFHGYSIHDELKWMVEAGLSPGEALLAATRRAAEMVGATEDFGTVQVGRRADLLLLSANPLEDIRNTHAIEKVILDGQVLDRGRLLP